MVAKSTYSKIIINNIFFFFCFFLFLLLLFRNPFSERTLIPNFEPYPDTFHYVTSAMDFFKNGGKLMLGREGVNVTSTVSPLYSFILVPAFLIFPEPRIFYFVNAILAFGSFIFFYLILRKIINIQWLLALPVFLYVSNYFIYWYPTLAMSENLLLLLFLIGTFLIVSSGSLKNKVVAGFITVSFYATKIAAVPFLFTYLISYLFKGFFEEKIMLVAGDTIDLR